jgi:DNA-binding CsgD family transcriptional regulator
VKTHSSVFVRQLCGLGLDSRALAPSLLPAIRKIIPAHSAAYFWVDGDAQITNLYAERMLAPEVMADYFSNHYREGEAGFASAFRARAATPGRVSAVTLIEGERATPYYREVLSRLGADHILYAVVGSRNRPQGQLSLYRTRDERAFSARELDTMRELLRYVDRGMGVVEGSQPSQLIESHDEALGVVSDDGSVLHGPSDWVRLMQTAGRDSIGAAASGDLVTGLRQLVLRVLASEGAALSILNPWGRFRLRAYRLSAQSGTDSWAIVASRAEARELALVRGADLAGLSPRQREVALLLVRGRTNQEIARQLGLSANTASYHVKQIFARLGVRARESVAQALMACAEETD